MDIASETTRRDSGIARAARPSQPAFDVPVADSGYRWWYLDGLSEDGLYGLTLIAFMFTEIHRASALDCSFISEKTSSIARAGTVALSPWK